MRLAALIIVGLSAACSTTPTMVATTTGAPNENLSESLYWASVDASGSRLCDPKKRAEYGSQFDRLFGERVRALKAAHEERYGPDPEFIVTTSCRLWRGSESELDHRHALAMDKFEGWLATAEQRLSAAR